MTSLRFQERGWHGNVDNDDVAIVHQSRGGLLQPPLSQRIVVALLLAAASATTRHVTSHLIPTSMISFPPSCHGEQEIAFHAALPQTVD